MSASTSYAMDSVSVHMRHGKEERLGGFNRMKNSLYLATGYLLGSILGIAAAVGIIFLILK